MACRLSGARARGRGAGACAPYRPGADGRCPAAPRAGMSLSYASPPHAVLPTRRSRSGSVSAAAGGPPPHVGEGGELYEEGEMEPQREEAREELRLQTLLRRPPFTTYSRHHVHSRCYFSVRLVTRS